MKDAQKDVPVTIRRAWLVAILAYGLPILAILLVIPKAQITGLGGFIDAIKTVFTVFGGHIDTAADGTVTPALTGFGSFMGDMAAIGFILALLSSGATWIMGADRSQAVAAYDGAGPRILGKFSGRYGTPIAVNYMSGIMATVVMVRRPCSPPATRPSTSPRYSTWLSRRRRSRTSAHLPGALDASPQVPRRRAAVPCAGRHDRGCGHQRAHNRLGGAGDHQPALARQRQRPAIRGRRGQRQPARPGSRDSARPSRSASSCRCS